MGGAGFRVAGLLPIFRAAWLAGMAACIIVAAVSVLYERKETAKRGCEPGLDG